MNTNLKGFQQCSLKQNCSCQGKCEYGAVTPGCLQCVTCSGTLSGRAAGAEGLDGSRLLLLQRRQRGPQHGVEWLGEKEALWSWRWLWSQAGWSRAGPRAVLRGTLASCHRWPARAQGTWAVLWQPPATHCWVFAIMELWDKDAQGWFWFCTISFFGWFAAFVKYTVLWDSPVGTGGCPDNCGPVCSLPSH